MRCKHWVFFMFGIFESIAELLCNRHHWSTHIQKTVPNSFLHVSVYMWMCHECRDCLFSRGNCWATTCNFYRQCFPVYPPSGYQNKVSILSDNMQIYLLWQRNQGMCLFSTVWCLNLLWNGLSAHLPMLYWWGHVCPIAQLAEVNGRVMFVGVLSEAIRQHLPCWFLLSAVHHVCSCLDWWSCCFICLAKWGAHVVPFGKCVPDWKEVRISMWLNWSVTE